MMIRLSLISLCAIGTVVVVGIFDDITKEADKKVNEFEDDSIIDIYNEMKSIQIQYNEMYNKFSNNLDILEKDFYSVKDIKNRSLPIPIPCTKK